jgi:hypothetical protein
LYIFLMLAPISYNYYKARCGAASLNRLDRY